MSAYSATTGLGSLDAHSRYDSDADTWDDDERPQCARCDRLADEWRNRQPLCTRCARLLDRPVTLCRGGAEAEEPDDECSF